MAPDFHFIPVDDSKTLDKLIRFLRPQGLNYQNWETWIERSYIKVLEGKKDAMIVTANGITIGDSISQPHKELKWFYEWKNMRILPGFQNDGCATFFEKQVERFARAAGAKAIIGDFRSDEKSMDYFLMRRGYTPLIKDWPLYDNNHRDTIMVKTLDTGDKNGILYGAKDFILGKA